MRNNRDDNQEESEYHFSDEDTNYDLDSDGSKSSLPTAPKENILSRMTQSKRMLISLGVFLALVFVVYKIVAPTASTPSTDITAPVVTAQQTTAMPKPTSMPVQQPVIPVGQATTVAQQSIQQMTPPPVSQTTTTTTTSVKPVIVQQPQTSMNIPMQMAPTEAAQGQPNQLPPVVSQSVSALNQMATTAVNQLQQPNVVANAMPAVGQVAAPVSATQQINVPGYAAADAGIANMTAENQKLTGQLQAEYAQKLNDYQSQNKDLQNQLQALNSKVADMETQMSQLIQTLSKQQAVEATPQPAAATEPKIAYTVQAIIPGRAWLRSDAGDTVTVTEGDVIKDVGRITKIDPYDGIVQVNTGTKVVSLTYGNNS